MATKNLQQLLYDADIACCRATMLEGVPQAQICVVAISGCMCVDVNASTSKGIMSWIREASGPSQRKTSNCIVADNRHSHVIVPGTLELTCR